MAGKTNAQLAAAFIAAKQVEGFEVYKQWHESQSGGWQDCYFIVPAGGGNNMTGAQLVARVRQWLQSKQIPKSEEQVRNITRVVIELTERRGNLPPDLTALQALGIEPTALKKKSKSCAHGSDTPKAY
jgi:hypothetical protein